MSLSRERVLCFQVVPTLHHQTRSPDFGGCSFERLPGLIESPMHSAAPDCYLWTRELLRFRQKLLKRISTAPSQRAREDPSWAEVGPKSDVFQLSIALSIVDCRLSIALTLRRRRGATAGFWTTAACPRIACRRWSCWTTRRAWGSEKANLLQEEEQDNQIFLQDSQKNRFGDRSGQNLQNLNALV